MICQSELRVNPHGGECVVRKIPTGADEVCEKTEIQSAHVCSVKAAILIYDTVKDLYKDLYKSAMTFMTPELGFQIVPVEFY